MNHSHFLLDIVREQKKGNPKGIYSICSANAFVIESALEFGKKQGTPILIEATSNQVNQYGGYTGMRPLDFINFVEDMAKRLEFPLENIILGGDHLGPNPWKSEPADKAMLEASDLIWEYVLAGFTKIHIDASMHLSDDSGLGESALDPKIIAERTAQLCQVAEKAYTQLLKTNPEAIAPVYVIGTEVPVPGGTQGDEEHVSVTTPEDFHQTVQVTKEAFARYGLAKAWERVVGVVVQPGVEFGDHSIHEYNREAATSLTAELAKYQGLVFEGHSTDYQQPEALRQMVEDGVGILKVGPELTFAFREAVFLLNHIEEELLSQREVPLSNLRVILEKTMLDFPENWAPYYEGKSWELAIARKYSLSDRVRYYWPQESVSSALETLLTNLEDVEIPHGVLGQYMPNQYAKVRRGELVAKPHSLIKDRIAEIYAKYDWATQLSK